MNIKKIKMLMLEKEITQNDLARLVGVSRNSINKALQGTRSITTDEAKKWCNALGIKDYETKGNLFIG